MTPRFKSFLLCTLSLVIFTTACQSATSSPLTIDMKSEEEQRQVVDNFAFDDYKALFDDVITEANQFDVEEPLRKWVIRTLSQEKLYYETDLTNEQVITLSTEAMKQSIAWKTVAKEKYNIHVTEEEIDRYIQQGPDRSDLPSHLAYASALGLSLHQLNHQFDRDLYEKNTIWLKLKLELEKKYQTDDNNELVNRYEAEVNAQLD
ncbi:hypothetical protein EVJ27_09155 [Exiguobacterium sp. SH3S2]|uniref:hypothetical protein n=1 Tax=unclassified Exiguobacterium TaxID=2644629 RepID=UPI00103E2754|nr:MULTISPECIES: hypothetical protein [unclassified Exiguobacterium]TCI44496.1 hypothetical protein EVJ28_09155 [Exiguobacterium sp. SH3S3]TCI56811.1 hypothetical protein EVJ30_02915 [Exiguobacterium sp. SH5S13]TCI59687.1 hypothetical protein EVJ26_12485 [Exiguobacterium sp. SH3S1]TCI60053.1 hypothetical protein EVJ27_09155 [Exiguobacterium sp. SH3S2]